MASKTYDAIVVGSGITGGWAAKELTEKGLETLVLEAGRPIDPAKDYAEHVPVWKQRYRGMGDRKKTSENQAIQSTSSGVDEMELPNSSSTTKRIHTPRRRQSHFCGFAEGRWVAGRSSGGGNPIAGAIWTLKRICEKASQSTGRFAIRTSSPGTTTSRISSASADRPRVFRNCPMESFCRRWN